MKVQKGKTPSTTPPNVEMHNIPAGILLRYGSLSCGPYLGVRDHEGGRMMGVVNVVTGVYSPQLSSYVLPGVVYLPNAVIMTGEED